MEIQPAAGNINTGTDVMRSNEMLRIAEKSTDDLSHIFKQLTPSTLQELLTKLAVPPCKKSFLVFRNNKYVNVLTDNIALFYIKYEASAFMCFDRQEYFVNYSLEQVQQLLPEQQFFRLNRQYLINFNAIKEVEHSFARKLLVNPVVAIKDKLLVSKEKGSAFLHWLDNR